MVPTVRNENVFLRVFKFFNSQEKLLNIIKNRTEN